MSRIISISLMHLYSISLTKQKRHSHPFIDFTLPLLLTTWNPSKDGPYFIGIDLFLSSSLSLSRLIHTHTHRILGHFVVIIEVPSGSSSLALTFYCHAHVWPIPHPCVIDGTLSWKGRCLLLNERLGHRPMEIVNERVILSLCYTLLQKFHVNFGRKEIGWKFFSEKYTTYNLYLSHSLYILHIQL